MTKPIYLFGTGEDEAKAIGDLSKRVSVLGGKGAHLCEMAAMGLPVPPGFVITTEVYKQFAEDGTSLALLMKDVQAGYDKLAKHLGYEPLVSVRSGAPVSMPGMMDTVLNVGLCKPSWSYYVDRLGEQAAQDCKERLNSMWRELVDDEADSTDLFDEKRSTQLLLCIDMVFRSWDNERARHYRKMYGIPEDMGTACVIQSMVFGNLNDKSGSGVMFTRDPSTGENAVVGEYLPDAQGEDVVSGKKTPLPLYMMKEKWPKVPDQLVAVAERLELHYRDMQDVEFTVENSKLWVLQTRRAKRSAKAQFRTARELVDAEVIAREEAVSRCTFAEYLATKKVQVDPAFKDVPSVIGLPGSGGCAVGKAVFSAKQALSYDGPCVLITEETTPDDIAGMEQAVAIVTRTGGTTCHAAVVARAMNKPCVVGCADLPLGSIVQGTDVSVDGESGRVWIGTVVPLVGGAYDEDVVKVVSWAAELNQVMLIGYGTSEGDAYVPLAGVKEAEVPELVERLAQKLEAGHQVVVDWREPYRYIPDTDLVFMGALGGSAWMSDYAYAVWFVRLHAERLKGACIVNGDKETCKSLFHVGWKEIRQVKTVADLVSGAPVIVPDEFVEKVVGGVDTWHVLMDALEAQGKKIQSARSSLTEAEVARWYLGGGAGE